MGEKEKNQIWIAVRIVVAKAPVSLAHHTGQQSEQQHEKRRCTHPARPTRSTVSSPCPVLVYIRRHLSICKCCLIHHQRLLTSLIAAGRQVVGWKCETMGIERKGARNNWPQPRQKNKKWKKKEPTFHRRHFGDKLWFRDWRSSEQGAPCWAWVHQLQQQTASSPGLNGPSNR